MTLADLWPVQSVTESGEVIGKNRLGFVFESGGVDVHFANAEQLADWHRKWRATLRLQPNDELQFIFRQRTDFAAWVERQLEKAFLAETPYGRRILLDKLAYAVEDMSAEEAPLLTQKILICYWTAEKLSDKQMVERRQVVQAQLAQFGVTVRPLNREQILREIYFSAGDTSASPRQEYEWPALQIEAGRVAVEGDYFRAAELAQLPETNTRFGMMEALLDLPYPLDVCVRLKARDARPIISRLERKRNLLQAKKGQKNHSSPAVESQVEQIEEILRSLADSSDQVFDLSMTVGVRLPKHLRVFQQRALAKILWAASQMDFCQLAEAGLGAFDAYLECLPTFHGRHIKTHTVLGSNAIHFLPLFKTVKGDADPVMYFRNTGRGLYGINPVDSRLANYNWLVSGTSGSGKSFFVNSLISQSQSITPNVYIVDIGGSYNKLTRFLGGKVMSLETESGFQISPFFLKPSGDPSEERLRRRHILQIFLEMVRVDGELPSLEIRQKLAEVLEEVLNLPQLPPAPISYIDERLAKDATPEAMRLRLLLRPWCGNGYFAQYLDNGAAAALEDRIIAFDLKGLNDFEELSRVVQLIICASIWAKVRRAGGERFSWIVLDEVAFTLLKSQPEFVDELISTLRKYYAGAVVVVQDLEKITSNKAGASILQNTLTKAILQQRGDPRHFAEALSLNAEELWAIENLRRQKGAFSEIFLIRDNEKVVLRHEPSRLEYWLSTTAPEDVVQLTKYFKGRKGDYRKNFLEFVGAAKEGRAT